MNSVGSFLDISFTVGEYRLKKFIFNIISVFISDSNWHNNQLRSLRSEGLYSAKVSSYINDFCNRGKFKMRNSNLSKINPIIRFYNYNSTFLLFLSKDNYFLGFKYNNFFKLDYS